METFPWSHISLVCIRTAQKIIRPQTWSGRFPILCIMLLSVWHRWHCIDIIMYMEVNVGKLSAGVWFVWWNIFGLRYMFWDELYIKVFVCVIIYVLQYQYCLCVIVLSRLMVSMFISHKKFMRSCLQRTNSTVSKNLLLYLFHTTSTSNIFLVKSWMYVTEKKYKKRSIIMACILLVPF